MAWHTRDRHNSWYVSRKGTMNHEKAFFKRRKDRILQHVIIFRTYQSTKDHEKNPFQTSTEGHPSHLESCLAQHSLPHLFVVATRDRKGPDVGCFWGKTQTLGDRILNETQKKTVWLGCWCRCWGKPAAFLDVWVEVIWRSFGGSFEVPN